MRILGISCYFHDAAAVLLEDGIPVAAAEEERFSRKKHDFEFPHNAIRFCLEVGKLDGGELDYVVFFEKPFVKFDRLLRTSLQGFPRTYSLFRQSMKTWLFDKLWIKSLIAREVGVDEKRILFSEHHLSHASSAYFCSPFDESAVITMDGVGEWTTTSIGVGRGNNLSLTHELQFPHSIGLLYSVFTAFLGFEVNEGEYKVMGMAPYGSPVYADKVWDLLQHSEDGSYRLDPRYFSFQYSTRTSYTSRFIEKFGEPRDATVPFFTDKSGIPSDFGERPRNYDELCEYNQHYANVAASIQLVTEELILRIAREAHRQTGSKRLCLAGGVALNSVANGRILRETPFEELYIQPSAGDGGGAIGAAHFAWHCALGKTQRYVMQHAYLGQAYGPDEVRIAVENAGIKSRHIEDEAKLVDFTVERLLEGKVIGWFQGRFEWGPRALGNRSILADPRKSGMKDVVNAKIKFREPFRPFAPSVLIEASDRYFDLPQPDQHMPARFMQLVVPVHEDVQDKIPAVSHMGTARIQTVYPEDNSLYHKVIQRFGEATGVPALLNTSFNVRGEPIANSPTDAIRTFGVSDIDTLVMGNEIVDR